MKLLKEITMVITFLSGLVLSVFFLVLSVRAYNNGGIIKLDFDSLNENLIEIVVMSILSVINLLGICFYCEEKIKKIMRNSI